MTSRREADLALAEFWESVQSELSSWKGGPLDYIVLTGGGAKFFEDRVRRAYPDTDVYQARGTFGSVNANASGFYFLGRALSK